MLINNPYSTILQVVLQEANYNPYGTIFQVVLQEAKYSTIFQVVL